jgi:hypothetical protein
MLQKIKAVAKSKTLEAMGQSPKSCHGWSMIFDGYLLVFKQNTDTSKLACRKNKLIVHLLACAILRFT